MTLYELPGSSDLRRKITWPLWIAGGVSFRPVERLLLSADVHWTQWSKLDRDHGRRSWIPSGPQLAAVEGRDVRVLDWKDATQIRFGAEYTLERDDRARGSAIITIPRRDPSRRSTFSCRRHTFNAVLGRRRQDARRPPARFRTGVPGGTTSGTCHADSGSTEAMPGPMGRRSSSRPSRSATSSEPPVERRDVRFQRTGVLSLIGGREIRGQ